MEYTREATVKIYKDTTKSTYEEELKMCEYRDDETMEEFLERVNKRMREIYLGEFKSIKKMEETTQAAKFGVYDSVNGKQVLTTTRSKEGKPLQTREEAQQRLNCYPKEKRWAMKIKRL